MREKIAIRLHTRERNLLKIIYEASPVNVSWEELTGSQREKFRKDASQILKMQCEEIEKKRLTDWEINQAIKPFDLKSEEFRGVAQDQLDKILSLLRPEK